MIPRFGRRDETEGAIIDALERMGFRVEQLSEPGVPDLLLSRAGRWYVAEAKSRKGRLTKAQTVFHGEARAPIPILRSVEDVVEWVRTL